MDKRMRNQAISYAMRLGVEKEVIARMREIEPSTMTLEQAQAALIECYVKKWGEAERVASRNLVRNDLRTVGLTLNRLAYFDLENFDVDMAAQAALALIYDDVHVLRQGG